MSTMSLSINLALHYIVGTVTSYGAIISCNSNKRIILAFAFAGGAASLVKLHNTATSLLCTGWGLQSYSACFVSQKALRKVISV